MKFKVDNNFTRSVSSNFIKMMRQFELPVKFNLIIGFSGGADSSALLFLAHKHCKELGFNLYAIHINHLIRHKEADRDEDFCKRICELKGIPFKSRRIDVPTLSKENKTGIEETARNVRYAEFTKYADDISKNGLPTYIATAHNSDDNAETVIFNITRGSALNGLCGIKPMRENVIRPLILCSKDDILGYCDENCIEYITDSTNIDKAYTRNRIRHDLIPSLKGINPSLLAAISRMTENIAEDELFLRQCAKNFLLTSSDSCGIKLPEFNNAHASLQRHVIFEFVKNSVGISLEDKHIKGIIELCRAAAKHSEFHFTGEFCAVIEGDRLTLKKKGDIKSPTYCIPVKYGINEIPFGVIGRYKSTDTVKISEFENIYKISTQTSICSDKIKGALFATPRHSGDTVNINNVNRKLKKLLNEIEPDLEKRAVLPIFRDDEGILWVPGARSRTETYPRSDNESEVLLYSYIKDNKTISTGDKNA